MIFIDGEFWHGKNWEERKYDHKKNREFWVNKIEKNLVSCILQVEDVIKNLKMNFTEKISLETFGDKQFRIRLIEPENNKEAILTHYLSNSNNGIAKFYKKDAIAFAKEILEYKYPKKTISSQVAEEALQSLTQNAA